MNEMLISQIDNGYVVTTTYDIGHPDHPETIKFFDNFDGVISWVQQFKFEEQE